MDNAIYELGRAQYRTAIGYDDLPKDDEGFVVLRPTAAHVDKKVASLTTDIDSLEEKLKLFRAEKAKAVKYQKTEEYKESKKNGKKKKEKKARATLLEMVFNNADANAEAEANEDDENYKDSKKKTPRKKNTLDTTYGTRFSPVVSMLYDSYRDFEQLATEIREELDSTQGRTKGMYRSAQMGNLIAATRNKFDVVNKLGDIAKVVSDLEYKKEKDKKTAEAGDSSKLIANIGAQFLRGGLDDGKGSKGKKGKKEKAESNFKKSARKQGYDPDDDDDEDIGRDDDVADNVALAKEFAKSLSKRKPDIKFTAHERNLDLEGKYSFVVACDPLDPEHTWEFIAVDDKGKKIKGFREEHKDLFPKKKACRMRFDTAKKKCTDLNSSRSYKLVFTD